MSIDWIPRLRGHADLVKRLVEEVPQALDRPGLSLDHAKRLRAVIQKGQRDFDEVLELMNEQDVDGTYRNAADNLAKIWSHLVDAAADKIQMLEDEVSAETDHEDEQTGTG